MNEISQIKLLKDLLDEFSVILANRPLMLGSNRDVHAMLYVFDNVDYILRNCSRMNYVTDSWQAFLIRKRYIKGSKNLFIEQLDKDPNDFTLLHNLRNEYKVWLQTKDRSS